MSRSAKAGRWPARAMTGVALLAAATSLSACKEAEKAEKDHYQPATLTPIKGDEEHQLITLTKLGASRIGIQTGRVQRGARGLTVPYASILYETEGGKAYVYVNEKGLEFKRESIEIERVAGDRVIIRKGPHVGAKVVT